WAIGDKVSDTVTYAHVQLGYMTMWHDAQLMAYDANHDSIPFNDTVKIYKYSKFATPIYQTIMAQLGLGDYHAAPWPRGWAKLVNKARNVKKGQGAWKYLPTKAIETYVGMSWAGPGKSGEDNVTHPQEQGIKSEPVYYSPLNSTSCASYPTISQGDGVYSNTMVLGVGSESTCDPITFTISYYDAKYDIYRLMRPLDVVIGEHLVKPSLTDPKIDAGTIDEKFKAGSCLGLVESYACFASGICNVYEYAGSVFTPPLYSVYSDTFPDNGYVGYTPIYSLTDSSENPSRLTSRIDLKQVSQIASETEGYDLNALEFYDMVREAMTDTEKYWIGDPKNIIIMRLIHCPPDNLCECNGHAVLPLWVSPPSSGIVDMSIYDPNEPQNDSVKVSLNLVSGVWEYHLSKTDVWTGTEINYLYLGDMPGMGEVIADVLDEEIYITNTGHRHMARKTTNDIDDGFTFLLEQGDMSSGWEKKSSGTICHPGNDKFNTVSQFNSDTRKRTVERIKINTGHRHMAVKESEQNDYIVTLADGDLIVNDTLGTTIMGGKTLFIFDAKNGVDTNYSIEFDEPLNTFDIRVNKPYENGNPGIGTFSAMLCRETDDGSATRCAAINHTGIISGEVATIRVLDGANAFEFDNAQGMTKTYQLKLLEVGNLGVSEVDYPSQIIDSGHKHQITAYRWSDLEDHSVFLNIFDGKSLQIQDELQQAKMLNDKIETNIEFIRASYVYTPDEHLVNGMYDITSTTYIYPDTLITLDAVRPSSFIANTWINTTSFVLDVITNVVPIDDEGWLSESR
ncbi:MAG: hypothetical protein B6I31_00110, partial [Desulfobacteraceae bacterium 4572_19]